MEYKVVRWGDSKQPTETAIRALLRAEGLEPYRWSNGTGDVYSPHSHGYHKIIYVIQGSITFGLPDVGDAAELQPGDRLELPRGVSHDAVVGPQGVVCLEAHRSSGPS